MNKHEYERQKELRQHTLNRLDIEILDNKIGAKRHNVETSRVQVDIAKEGTTSAQISLEQAKLGNELSREKLTQVGDNLKYEKAMTGVNRERLMIQGKQALLALEEAKQELAASQDLTKLKFDSRGLGGI